MHQIRYSVFLFLLLGFFSLSAQNNNPALPVADGHPAPASQAAPSPAGAVSVFTDPPVLPVRTMAEWEELQAILITWRGQSTILTEIVRAAREECRVIIACNTQGTVGTAQNILLAAGVDISSNVDFLVAPNNSIWVRDYGPNCVYANEVDSLYFVDWRYNRTQRPLDDQMPTVVASFLNVPLYTTTVAPFDLVHTGGNFMSDGMGTAFSSELIMEENSPGNPYGVSVKSESDINNIMSEYMGIDRYIKFANLPYDLIHHIDMHMKLLDEETLLVGEYPEGESDGPQIEANIQYLLSNFQSSFQQPYKVIRVPMPPDGNGLYPAADGDYRTYANAVFVNKTVIVPFYDEQFDTTAQRIWEEALPGYKITGINCNSIIGQNGAIHCITKEIGVPDPLRIVHQPLPDVIYHGATGPQEYPVYTTLQHRSGIQSAKVWYKTDNQPAWQSVDMVSVPDTADVWRAAIPAQTVNQFLYYYIEAQAENGKVQKRPMPAPDGWWKVQLFPEMSASQDIQPVSVQPVFPNPGRAITCLPVYSAHSVAATIQMVNAYGQVVEVLHQGLLPAGESKFFIFADQYAPGAYFLETRTADQRHTQKFLITR